MIVAWYRRRREIYEALAHVRTALNRLHEAAECAHGQGEAREAIVIAGTYLESAQQSLSAAANPRISPPQQTDSPAREVLWGLLGGALFWGPAVITTLII